MPALAAAIFGSAGLIQGLKPASKRILMRHD
jgi:hypothetical protein